MIEFNKEVLDADWLTERIAVGAQSANLDAVLQLRSRCFTDIVCCTQSPPVEYLSTPPLSFRVIHCPQADDGTRRDPSLVRQGVRFAMDALAIGGRVYVHCAAGVNRSPLMCYGIFRAVGFPRREAIAIVSSRRTCANFMSYPAYLDSVDEALATADT